jgi:hypothetical protein
MPCPSRSFCSVGVQFRVKFQINIEVKIKVKIKVKSSGQECPLHTAIPQRLKPDSKEGFHRSAEALRHPK